MQYESKATFVANTLRREIQAGVLEPGEVLRQRAIASRFGVSPTPVREALSRLEAEGFVVMELHRGASVVRTALSRLSENAQIRAVLETLAVELAARHVDAKAVEEMKQLNERFRANGGNDPAMAESLNRLFHFRIYQAAESPVLLRFLEQLWDSLDTAPNAYRQHSDSVHQHEELLAAIGDGDAARAREVIMEHVFESAERMRAEISSGKSRTRQVRPTPAETG